MAWSTPTVTPELIRAIQNADDETLAETEDRANRLMQPEIAQVAHNEIVRRWQARLLSSLTKEQE